MSKRNENLTNLLIQCPWWVSVILAGVIYVIFALIVPLFSFTNPTLIVLRKAGPILALLAVILLLGIALLSALVSWLKRLQLDSQKGIESIRALNWKQFEELIGEAYRRQGFVVTENMGSGPDDGIDLILQKNAETTLVQCKQWRKTKVGVSVVREMLGILTAKRASQVIIVTSGNFTTEAQRFATNKPIVLIDGNALESLIASVQNKGTSNLHKHGSQQLPPPLFQNENLCPRCGSALVLRTARQGSHAGTEFYGCSAFPKCRYTRNITST